MMVQRRRLHEAVTEAIRLDPDLEDSVLAGWVLIFETVQVEDTRCLSVRSGDASGEQDLVPWQAEGWLRYAAERETFFVTIGDEDEAEDE